MDGCEEPAEENGDPHGAEEQVTAATAAGEVRQGLRKRRPAAATARNQLQFGSRALLAAAKRRARGTRCGERRRAGPGGARGWHDTLPNELVGEVLARLPTRSYLLASRLVCHTWNRLVLSCLAELPCCIVMCQFEPEGLPEVSADEYRRRLKEVGCQRAISIDTRTCEQREIKLPLSFDHLSYTSGKWGLIILDNEEDCYWVGNPLTSAWRAIPYPFDPGSIHTRFAFVVNSETGCYNIVVFYMSVPRFENRELEEGTMWTHIFDSKSCKWREGPSWAACFSGSWLETWVFNGLVYFSYRPRYQHLELWSMDLLSDTFQQVTRSTPLPRCLRSSFELVVRRHLGVQSIELVGMTRFTQEQEMMEVSNPQRRTRHVNDPWEEHFRAYVWNSTSGT